MHLGAEIAIETIDKMLENNGNIDSISQGDFSQFSEDELKTAPKIFKETCQIDWTLPAKRVYDFVRGLSPYPGTWTHLEENGRQSVLKIFKTAKTSATGSGDTGSIKIEKAHLYVLELQMAGKKRMNARDFLNGMRGKSFRMLTK